MRYCLSSISIIWILFSLVFNKFTALNVMDIHKKYGFCNRTGKLFYVIFQSFKLINILRWNVKKKNKNKKHSENAGTSTSVTFDLVVWPWSVVKVKKADVVRCRFLYCTLVPGMMSMGSIVYEISPFVYFMWPLPITCDLLLLSRSLEFQSLDLFNVFECLYQKWSLYTGAKSHVHGSSRMYCGPPLAQMYLDI